MKRALIIVALLVVVGLPFVLRRQDPAALVGDDRLVIISPHNEAIRYECGQAFKKWYHARTGRTVVVDWRVLGGTSEIARFLEGEYITSFQNHWVNELHRPWSAAVQAGSQNGHLPEDAPAEAKEARAAFLASEVGCGIDLFFGGGTYDFSKQAAAGRLVPTAILQKHPEWFADDVIPRTHAGAEFRDPDGRWIGTVLSSYGIIYNRDALRRLGIPASPAQWADLTSPRYLGEIALCDPTKSGSISEAFENVIQQRMHLRLKSLKAERPAAPAAELEAQAVREGWIEGLQLIQLVGANARYFTDSSQKPPIDVSTGDCAAGMCIDFYGRAEVEAVSRRSGTDRLGFDSPPGGTAYSVDPIALLRGARHRALAEAFIEFELSPEGQRLWNQEPGTPGGPERYALRRLPVRMDYYAHGDWRAFRSDPDVNPYDQEAPLIYREEWTGGIFREMAFLVRVMCQDTHAELQTAWRAITTSRQAPERIKAAMDSLQDLSFVSYDHARTDIRRALGSKNKVDEIQLAKELAGRFRAHYARAAQLAGSGAP